MVARNPILLLACAILIACSDSVWGQGQEELRSFVNDAVADLVSSPLEISRFNAAQADAIEDLGSIGGVDRYLCWLKNDQGRAGYIAVAVEGEAFHVMALSATTEPPDYFLQELEVGQLRSLNLLDATQTSFVESVPLVAAPPTFVGGKSFEVSDLAASLSAVLNYRQSNEKILLFGHVSAGEDPEYTRRFREDPTSSQLPQDPAWESFENERRRTVPNESLPPGQSQEGRAAFGLRQQNSLSPIIRRRLLDPVNARERLEILHQEWMGLNTVIRIDTSSGMKDAVLLQRSYLQGGHPSVKQDLNLFFRTRGRRAELQMGSIERLPADSIPAILIGPGDLAGVLLGFIDIDGVRFASVFFPKTGTPIKMTLAEKLANIRKAKGLPPEPQKEEQIRTGARRIREIQERDRKLCEERGVPYQAPIKDPEQWMRQGIERYEAMTQGSPIVEDRLSSTSTVAGNGTHLLACSSLTSWQVLHIVTIDVGDNWGK